MQPAILTAWAADIRPHPPEARRQHARTRLAAIDAAHAKMLRGDGPTIRQFQASGLTAFDIPVVKDWLGTVARTGEVPA